MLMPRRALAALALIVALAGCTATGASEVAERSDAEAASGPEATAAPQDTSAPQQGPFDERQVMRTGTLTVRTGDVQQAAARLRDLAAANQGIVVDERVYLGDGSSGTTRVVISVPSDSLTRVMDEAAKVGELVDRTVTAKDVTDQVVDVEARIRTLRASIERIRALMQKTGSITAIAAVESELTQRQSELESLLGRQAALKNQVESAPITVTLIGPDQVAPSTNPFVIGLSQGWEALQKSIGMLLTIIGAVLPFALVGGAIPWPLLRRHRTRAAARSEQPTE